MFITVRAAKVNQSTNEMKLNGSPVNRASRWRLKLEYRRPSGFPVSIQVNQTNEKETK
jgi:hypothetical protein